MSMTAVALVWNHAALLEERNDDDDLQSLPALVRFRQTIENGLSSIANAIEKNHSTQAEALVADESGSECVRLTTARYNEIHALSLSLVIRATD
jgi:hypothetical protein